MNIQLFNVSVIHDVWNDEKQISEATLVLNELETSDQLIDTIKKYCDEENHHITINWSCTKQIIDESEIETLKARLDNIYSYADDVASYVRSAIDELEEIDSIANAVLDECDY